MKKVFSLIKFLIKILPDLPKSIYFNFTTLPFKQAIQLPVIISRNTVIGNINKNCIEIKVKVKMGMIIFGKGGLERIIVPKKNYLSVEKGSKIIFNGSAIFSMGSSIKVANDAILIFGNNFYANRNFTLVCVDSIEFGNDILIGWNVEIRDTDGHYIIENGEEKSNHSPITVENHVWICSYATIMKGCKIGNNCVVAYKSCLIKSDGQDNCLMGGYPAKILRQEINWHI